MKFLIIDDDIDFRNLTKRQLQNVFPESTFREIATRKEFDETLADWDFDIVITDLENVEIDGLTVCQEIRNRDPYLPVIMLTASGNEEFAVKGMKLGLSDYITKSHLIRLPVSIRESLEKTRIQREYDKTTKLLKTSEERFHAFMDNSPVLSYIVDENFRIQYINKQCERFFHTALEKASGKTVFDVLPAEAAGEFHENDRAAFSAQKTTESCETVFTHDGVLHHWQVFRFPLQDINGQQYLGGVAVDVTIHTINERHQHAQFTLTHIFAESATVDEAAPKILQIICEGFGWELGELWNINQALYVLKLNSMWCIPSLDVSEFERLSRTITFARGIDLPGRVWASGGPVWIPDVLTDSNFPRVAIASKLGLHGAMAFPLTKGTEIVGVMGFLTKNIRPPDKDIFNTMADIGRRIGGFITRKAAEELLRTSEHKYRTLIENLPQRIFHKDKNSVYISCNERYAQDLKIKPGEIEGKTDHNFFPHELAEKYRADDKRLMESGQTEEIEEKYIHEGREIIINTVKTPMKDEHGNIVGIIGIFWDITEKKHAEEARNQLTDILETTTDFVATAGVDGRLLYINKTGKKMLGLSESEDISSLFVFDCFPEWARTLIMNEAIPNAVSAGVWSGESSLLNRGGYEIPASQVIIAHKNPDGSVKYFSTIARDITDRKRFEEQIVFMANRDPLTGLYNRRRFQEELNFLLIQTRRLGNQGVLLFMDLDNFKDINDSFGHQAGDKLLISLAPMLQTRFRETDIVARLGGDEFAILLPYTDPDKAVLIAEQLLDMIKNQLSLEEGHPLGMTASIGIVVFPKYSDSAETLLAYADLAMYRAKEEGRNRVCMYEPEHKTYLESRLLLEKRIRNALKYDRFILHLQPINDLSQNRVVGHEALLRMIGEQGELIPPGSFLNVAERFGLIRDIDRWVVIKSIRILKELSERGQSCYLEVNLSGKSFVDKEILPLIREELTKTGVNPRNLIFEITETAVVENIGFAQRFIAELKAMGCRFALDDFGTGFSSFNYLRRLPVEYLKIDGSFIQNLIHDPVDQHLVKAMVEVARGLEKKTIAEFVENAETVHLLRELGVNYAQGYYIGKPLPISELL